MAGIESFSASMVELEKEMAELDRQLSEEKERASNLELAALTSARRKEFISRDIHTTISDICELEMEAEDLDSLTSEEQSARAMPRPGQEGATNHTREAVHEACNEFVAACSSFRGRHSSLQQKVAAVEAQNGALDLPQKMSEARAALASAQGRRRSTQERLGAIAEASERIACKRDDLRARVNKETERGGRLRGEQEQLEREQRRALEEAEKELCASTLQDDIIVELQKETRTLSQQARRGESTGTSLRSALKSKEDDLANLQRSLQALSGPAKLSQPKFAVLSRSAGSDFPGTGNTGVFCNSNQAKAQQLVQGVLQSPTDKPYLQGFAPQSTAAVASVQQPRPAISLVNSSVRQRSHLTVRQHHLPQLSILRSPSPSQAEAGPQHNRDRRPEQASHATAQYNGELTQNVLSQPSRQGPGKPAWKQRPSQCSSNNRSTQQCSQRAVQKTLTAYPACGHMQMQAPRSAAGQSDSHNSEGTAQQAGGAAAAPALLQHQGGAKQPDRAGHPAIPPVLEPVPYTVQEPDSPPLQGAGTRRGTPARPQAQMPPACIFTETTITRTITPGRSSARAESTWSIRKVHEAGEGAAHCSTSAGIYTPDPQQQGGMPFMGAPQSFREEPGETTRKHCHPRSESLWGPAQGGKGKAGSRGRKAKGPRKRLKRILRSDDEDSLALYHPEAADKRFKEAQLEAEEDLVLSSLW